MRRTRAIAGMLAPLAPAGGILLESVVRWSTLSASRGNWTRPLQWKIEGEHAIRLPMDWSLSGIALLALVLASSVNAAGAVTVAEDLRVDLYVEKGTLAMDFSGDRRLSVELDTGVGSVVGYAMDVVSFSMTPSVTDRSSWLSSADFVWLGSVDAYGAFQARDFGEGVVPASGSCAGFITPVLVAHTQVSSACTGSSVNHAECDAAIDALGQAMNSLVQCFIQLN